MPNVDASVVTRILEAGGTVLGKAVCENLSLWGLSDSSATGPISNVYAEGYSAGGSSSGSGVLVARGDVDLAIGGDQGGSIRIPAAKNGIVGMKPTHGLVPYTGVVSLEPTLDHVGPMSRVSRKLSSFRPETDVRRSWRMPSSCRPSPAPTTSTTDRSLAALFPARCPITPPLLPRA